MITRLLDKAIRSQYTTQLQLHGTLLGHTMSNTRRLDSIPGVHFGSRIIRTTILQSSDYGSTPAKTTREATGYLTQHRPHYPARLPAMSERATSTY